MEAYINEFADNIWLYLSMPLISAVVGYATNVIAIKMMFYPVEFLANPLFLAGRVSSRAELPRWLRSL